MNEQGEIILYQPDEALKLDVRVEDETVWLNQSQIVSLFTTSKANISEHLKNIFESGELNREATVRKFRTVRLEGERQVTRNIEFFNLDVIISVGYRVNTIRGIQFRQWANKVLKEYLLRGYSVNHRLDNLERKVDTRLVEHDQKLKQLSDKVDFFVRTSLPPVEGIFYKGQIFDAYKFATDLIRSAKRSIVLIDNYVDESVLMMLSKRGCGVEAIIYTPKIERPFALDLERHNAQYPTVNVRTYRKSHDRFMIIDNTDVYHIGASLKDLGKKLFAFSKLEMSPDVILTDL